MADPCCSDLLPCPAADRHSQNLANLGQASRGVSEATGSVVATAKSCMELVEDKGTHYAAPPPPPARICVH